MSTAQVINFTGMYGILGVCLSEELMQHSNRVSDSCVARAYTAQSSKKDVHSCIYTATSRIFLNQNLKMTFLCNYI